MSEKDVPKPACIVDDGPFREPIAKLGKMITDRIPQKLGIQKITKDDPEYWSLAAIATDEEAERKDLSPLRRREHLTAPGQ